MLNCHCEGEKENWKYNLMRKERKRYSFDNSFCKITTKPSSKFNTLSPLKMELNTGNFHIPVWMQSPIFIPSLASERDCTIGNHILQQNQPLQMYFYHSVSISFLRQRWGMVQFWV